MLDQIPYCDVLLTCVIDPVKHNIVERLRVAEIFIQCASTLWKQLGVQDFPVLHSTQCWTKHPTNGHHLASWSRATLYDNEEISSAQSPKLVLEIACVSIAFKELVAIRYIMAPGSLDGLRQYDGKMLLT